MRSWCEVFQRLLKLGQDYVKRVPKCRSSERINVNSLSPQSIHKVNTFSKDQIEISVDYETEIETTSSKVII